MSGFGFNFTNPRLVIRKPELDHLLNDPTGEVGVYLKRRGQIVLAAAKRQVGSQTGLLRASIQLVHTRQGAGQYLWIGSYDSIAYMHHEGTRPHIIEARAEHKMLRFTSGGRVIYTRRVMHPGTRPNRYLTDNLRLIRS